MRRVREAWGVKELALVAGLALMAGGLAMVSVPAALVVTGALLFGLAVGPSILPRRGP